MGVVGALKGGVIVTAKNNAAVASLAHRLLDSGIDPCEIVLWGENCDESVRFLNPHHRKERYRKFLRDYSASDKNAREEKLHEFSKWLRQDSGFSLASLSQTCNARNPFESTQVRIVLCTLNTAGSSTLRGAVCRSQQIFDMLILDEASQCPEAEFYIACTFPGVKRILVVGDPKQLSSTVVNSACRDAGYADSFLFHLFQARPDKIHLLDTQYRMDPEIFNFCNDRFYGSRVLSAQCVRGRSPSLDSPFLLIDTRGAGEEEMVSKSFRNKFEATEIKRLLNQDADICKLLRSEKQGSLRIMIITPYSAQVAFLKKALKKQMKATTFGFVEIATVDSFQGQEGKISGKSIGTECHTFDSDYWSAVAAGDIVIVSTVRSLQVGFTDDPNRLNVALTRAKRIVRIIGDLSFFSSLPPNSTLRDLATFVKQSGLVKKTKCSALFLPPDWSIVTQWKSTMTSRFWQCVNEMDERHRNLAFNTVYAISKPSLHLLSREPIEGNPPRWQLSVLKKIQNLSSVLRGNESPPSDVWVAKPYELDGQRPQSVIRYAGIIEAHFTGTEDKCRQFIQKNQLVPKDTRNPSRGLDGIVPYDESTATHTTQLDLAWNLTNALQGAAVDNDQPLKQLPEGLFMLDPHQERVIHLQPPLLLESRSGTGKTNVLFQHAISYYPHSISLRRAKPIAFVTVSSRLCEELQKRYDEIETLNRITLPPICFFTFTDLLTQLLRKANISMDTSSVCTFVEYEQGRQSHERLREEASLIENEIGGVILGSLDAALQQRPLSEQEYLSVKRSNVSIDTEQGMATRKIIYNEYVEYKKWKGSNGKYDLGDIILQLIRTLLRYMEQSDQFFQSGKNNDLYLRSCGFVREG